MTRFAAIQLVSTDDVKANLVTTAKLIQQAADQGAECIVLPENFALMAEDPRLKLSISESLHNGPLQSFIAEQAISHHCYLIAGTIPIRSPESQRVFATTLVYTPSGECLAHYHKMHLFDVVVSEQEQYQESATIYPGDTPQVIELPFAKIGLSICYDIRFPELYRDLVAKGAEVLVVPSAFTAVTGSAHWEILCRARAIENLCYLIAPNQGGQHNSMRETYGNSLIVDYWGRILASHPLGIGVITADIDLGGLRKQRELFPAIQHRRLL